MSQDAFRYGDILNSPAAREKNVSTKKSLSWIDLFSIEFFVRFLSFFSWVLMNSFSPFFKFWSIDLRRIQRSILLSVSEVRFSSLSLSRTNLWCFLVRFLIALFSSLLLIPRASCLSMFYSEDTRVSYTSTLPPIQSVLSFLLWKCALIMAEITVWFKL